MRSVTPRTPDIGRKVMASTSPLRIALGGSTGVMLATGSLIMPEDLASCRIRISLRAKTNSLVSGAGASKGRARRRLDKDSSKTRSRFLTAFAIESKILVVRGTLGGNSAICLLTFGDKGRCCVLSEGKWSSNN